MLPIGVIICHLRPFTKRSWKKRLTCWWRSGFAWLCMSTRSRVPCLQRIWGRSWLSMKGVIWFLESVVWKNIYIMIYYDILLILLYIQLMFIYIYISLFFHMIHSCLDPLRPPLLHTYFFYTNKFSDVYRVIEFLDDTNGIVVCVHRFTMDSMRLFQSCKSRSVNYDQICCCYTPWNTLNLSQKEMSSTPTIFRVVLLLLSGTVYT